MYKHLMLTLSFLLPLNALAQEDIPFGAALENIEVFSDVLPLDELGQERGPQRVNRQKSIIDSISNQIHDVAKLNISKPEQVFCYRVTPAPQNYTGYTIDNRAVIGYCGELNYNQITTVYEALFTQSMNILTQKSNCSMEPRIILRFARGVEYTDVILSLPCPSFAVIHAGRRAAFNVRQGVIDDLVNTFEKTNLPFYSPTLLKQTVANATLKDMNDEDLVNQKQKENAPVMSWKERQEQKAQEQKSKPEPKGWGKINIKLKNQGAPAKP